MPSSLPLVAHPRHRHRVLLPEAEKHPHREEIHRGILGTTVSDHEAEQFQRTTAVVSTLFRTRTHRQDTASGSVLRSGDENFRTVLSGPPL